MHSDSKQLIIALDFPDSDSAVRLLDQLDPALCRVKVGKELFTRCGPQLLNTIHGRGFEIFLDLKFHDIPNTVAGAVKAAAEHGVWMVNVHASGGRAMMEAARTAIGGQTSTLLTAVTILTSLTNPELLEIGYADTTENQVLRLARLANEAGMDGVVCSALEITALRAALPGTFLLVTPGIRPVNASKDDQNRTQTPGEAVHLGSNYLVIGRPVTQAQDPAGKMRSIYAEIQSKK